MEIHELSFLKIIKLADDLIEAVVNEGVEITLDMVEEYHAWIRANLKHPCYILVNRINSYTYTFDAQLQISTLPEIRAIALLAYSRPSQLAAESLIALPRVNPWNCQIFSDRDAAIAWLDNQRSLENSQARNVIMGNARNGDGAPLRTGHKS